MYSSSVQIALGDTFLGKRVPPFDGNFECEDFRYRENLAFAIIEVMKKC